MLLSEKRETGKGERDQPIPAYKKFQFGRTTLEEFFFFNDYIEKNISIPFH